MAKRHWRLQLPFGALELWASYDCPESVREGLLEGAVAGRKLRSALHDAPAQRRKLAEICEELGVVPRGAAGSRSDLLALLVGALKRGTVVAAGQRETSVSLAARAEPAPSRAPAEEVITEFFDVQILWEDSGKPLRNLPIIVQPPGAGEMLRVTDGEGRVHVDGVRPGACAVRCQLDGERLEDCVGFAGDGAVLLPQAELAKAPARDGVSARAIVSARWYKVQDGDTLESLAGDCNVTWQALAKFNFGVDSPPEVNEHLRKDVGCTEKTADGANYKFRTSDHPGRIALPKVWKVQLDTSRHHVVRVKPILRPPKTMVCLRLGYEDPDGKVWPFPKDFPVKVAFGDGESLELRIPDEAGTLRFEVPDAGKRWFTLKFEHGQARFLVHEAGKPVAEVKEGLGDAELRQLTLDGKKLFALPKTWSLVHATWKPQGFAVPQSGQIPIVGDIGSEAAPAALTLAPRCQFVRFEFFDRKYGVKDHGGKPVSLPAVVLKGARKCSAQGAPTAPVAGTHDAISNWVVDAASAAGACQALPWIVVRDDAGADLPGLARDMLLEFGWERGFVHSTSATERKIVEIPAGDARLEPGKDRSAFYDLPKQWKSCCYYARFPDPARNRFFDELAAAADPELAASFAKDRRIVFSLDDLVLVDAAGSQALKDKDENADVALSEHSRVAVLWLDPADAFKVKVHKPRAKAAYFSESEFVKEAAAAARRNALVDVPPNPRAVVFCNGFYDVFDKRTEAADFGKKELLGARAAKLGDADVSSAQVVFSNQADADAGYVHRTRRFHLRYLHYGGTDGTTVYGALVTHWQARFEKDAGQGGSDADVTLYREEGLERAMRRWNEKDYTFEQRDGGKDLAIKHFCLFEAKDIETPPGSGTFVKRGGPHVCLVTVTDDTHGSSATDDTMQMRKSGAKDEGDRWGAAPTDPAPRGLSALSDHGGASAPPRSAFAHELGHAAIGLWDEYVTGTNSWNDGTDDRSSWLWSYTDNDREADRQGQRYYGMPYELDEPAIMKINRAVRVRHLWGRANWLNDQAASTLNAFLSGKQFRLAYASPSGKLVYDRPAAHKSIYGATPKQLVSLGKQGKCDVHLYYLGDDEYSRTLKGGPYTGILAAGIKISARFHAVLPWGSGLHYDAADLVSQGGVTYCCTAAHTSAAAFATDAARWIAETSAWAPGVAYAAARWVFHAGKFHRCASAHTSAAPFDPGRWTEEAEVPGPPDAVQQWRTLETLGAGIRNMLQRKFKFVGSGDFKTTHLRVFTQWENVAPGDPATGGANVTHLIVDLAPDSFAFKPKAGNIKMGMDCSRETFARYVFGKIGDDPTQWAAEGGAVGALTKADLSKLKEWMDANAGGTFVVQDIP